MDEAQSKLSSEGNSGVANMDQETARRVLSDLKRLLEPQEESVGFHARNLVGASGGRRKTMDAYEAIRSRLTVRDFKPDPIPDTIIRKMLYAARWAPSARNRQPWHFIVIQSPETLREIGSIASSESFIGRAPLAVAVVMDHANRPELDAGRTLQQMELAAWSEGVGGCVAGIRGEENRQVKELLAIPEDLELVTVMAFGYPTDAARAGGKRRKPVSEIAHSERFGQGFGSS